MDAVAAPVGAVAPAAVPPRITVASAPTGVRTRVALDELEAALAGATTAGEATLTVTAGDGDPDDDTYRLDGDATALRVTARSEAGAARGVYDLATAVRTGHAVTERLGTEVTSRLRFRMVDLGAVGVTRDEAWSAGTDYSHASKAFADVLLAEAPYVDEQALATAYDDFDTFVRHSLANGFTAVAFPGFVELVTFADVADGPVYAEDDDHVARALALRKAFRPFWDRADELGMDVFLRTDMLTLTTPLAAAPRGARRVARHRHPRSSGTSTPPGSTSSTPPMPSLDGVLMRIGEAGRVYDLVGWDYYSELAVTTVAAVRAMLTTLTEQAEARAGRWSSARGASGSARSATCTRTPRRTGPCSTASTRPRSSCRRSTPSVTSTATCRSTTPSRPGPAPAHRRAAEPARVRGLRRHPQRPRRGVPGRPAAAARREPEHRGRLGVDPGRRPVARGPDDPLPQDRLLAAVRAQHVARGPPRPRPGRRRRRAHPRLGAALVLRRPRHRHGDRRGDAPLPRRDRARACTSARSPSSRVFAIGLEPPPMMWIFEWDILTGDSAVLDLVYEVSRDRVDEAVAEGSDAVAIAEELRTWYRTDAPMGKDSRDAGGIHRDARPRGRRAWKGFGLPSRFPIRARFPNLLNWRQT